MFRFAAPARNGDLLKRRTLGMFFSRKSAKRHIPRSSKTQHEEIDDHDPRRIVRDQCLHPPAASGRKGKDAPVPTETEMGKGDEAPAEETK
jgi:hypothetical protein